MYNFLQVNYAQALYSLMWVQCFVASQLCCLLCLNGVCCDRNYFENYLLSVVNTTGSTYKEVWDSFGFHAVHEQAIQTRPLSVSSSIYLFCFHAFSTSSFLPHYHVNMAKDQTGLNLILTR